MRDMLQNDIWKERWVRSKSIPKFQLGMYMNKRAPDVYKSRPKSKSWQASIPEGMLGFTTIFPDVDFGSYFVALLCYHHLQAVKEYQNQIFLGLIRPVCYTAGAEAGVFCGCVSLWHFDMLPICHGARVGHCGWCDCQHCSCWRRGDARLRCGCTWGCNDAGLPHATPQHLPVLMHPGNEGLRACHHAPNRRSQTLLTTSTSCLTHNINSTMYRNVYMPGNHVSGNYVPNNFVFRKLFWHQVVVSLSDNAGRMQWSVQLWTNTSFLM